MYDSSCFTVDLYVPGLSHLLEYMAFKSTSNRTHFRLTREVESIGANLLASASREQMAYNVDVAKTSVPEALEVLVDSVVNPKFLAWEVAAAVEKMREDIKSVKDNPQTVLMEVHAPPKYSSCCFFFILGHYQRQLLDRACMPPEFNSEAA